MEVDHGRVESRLSSSHLLPRSTMPLHTSISPDPHTMIATSPLRGPVWTLRSAPASPLVDACHTWDLVGGSTTRCSLKHLSRQHHFDRYTRKSSASIVAFRFFTDRQRLLYRLPSLLSSTLLAFAAS